MRITPGLAADLIAMPDDPLTNINALKSVTFVMKKELHLQPAPCTSPW